MEKYIVLLKDKLKIQEFIEYLEQNNIVIDFKDEDSLIFIIIIDENQSALIKAIDYVQEIFKDEIFKVNLEKVNEQENLESKIAPLEAVVDYKNWGVNRVLAPCMWRRGITGQGVNVAVLDTGIGPHVDLNVAGDVSFTGEPTDDGNGHGTGVAGIIAARNFGDLELGVAYDVSLYNVKVLDNSGNGTTAWLIQGILWCGNNNIQVANMSLYYDQGQPGILSRLAIQAALLSARNNGCIFVGISGNDGINEVFYPGSANGVISVGATDINNVRATFSNYGNGLDYVAPGVDIYTTDLNDGYTTVSGTSMAAPHVTSVIALLLDEDPSRTQSQIEQILTASALDLGDPGYDIEYGNGLVRCPLYPMTLIVNPSMDVYDCEKTGELNIFAYDNLGNPIEEVPIDIKITTPSGIEINASTETDSNGKAKLEMLFNCCMCNENPDNLIELNEIGEYSVEVTAYPTCSPETTSRASFIIEECELQASVYPNKNVYSSIDNGVIIGEVKDRDGKIVEDADLKFTIITPSNQQIEVYGKTNDFGMYYFNFQVDCPGVLQDGMDPILTEIGDYVVQLEATKECYKTALAETSFSVLETSLMGDIFVKDKICMNDNELFWVWVKDESGRVVSNANVELTIKSPLNIFRTFNLTTNQNGLVCVNIVTNGCDYVKYYKNNYFAQSCGEYEINAIISKSPCYENLEISGEFEVIRCCHH